MGRAFAIWAAVVGACLLVLVGVGTLSTAFRGTAADPSVALRTPTPQLVNTIVESPVVNQADSAKIAPTLLTSTPAPAAEPPQPPPAPAVNESPAQPALLVKGTEGSGLVLRRAPGGDRVASASEGEVVVDLGEQKQAVGRAWQKIRAPDGTEGWAAAEFLVPADLAQSPPTAPSVPSATPTAVPTKPAPPATPTSPPAAVAPRLLPPPTAAPAPARVPATATQVRPTATPVPPGNFIPYPGNGGGPTRCRDGSISNSSGRGTCSHHGGIAR
jgi:hypothetical protein